MVLQTSHTINGCLFLLAFTRHLSVFAILNISQFEFLLYRYVAWIKLSIFYFLNINYSGQWGVVVYRIGSPPGGPHCILKTSIWSCDNFVLSVHCVVCECCFYFPHPFLHPSFHPHSLPYFLSLSPVCTTNKWEKNANNPDQHQIEVLGMPPAGTISTQGKRGSCRGDYPPPPRSANFLWIVPQWSTQPRAPDKRP